MSGLNSNKKAYLSDSTGCLVCSTPGFASIIEDGGDTTVLRENVCFSCKSEWEDKFTLIDVTLNNGGKLDIKNLSALQKSRYLEHGQACPVCQNTGEEPTKLGLSIDELKVEDDKGTLEVLCHRCNCAWTDHYKLSDAELIVNRGEEIESL